MLTLQAGKLILQIVANRADRLFQVIGIGTGMDLIAVESELALRGVDISLFVMKRILPHLDNRFGGSA